MDDIISLPGTIRMYLDRQYYTNNILFGPREYLQRLYHDTSDVKSEKDTEPICYSDEKHLWKNIIYDDLLYEKAPIKLKNFKLLDWIPQAPGLYHKKKSQMYRESFLRNSDYFMQYIDGNPVIYDPHEKAALIRSGIGCLRVNMKPIGETEVKFYCATSSGIAHGGIIVSVDGDLYPKVARLIKDKKVIVCDIDGEIAVLPKDLTDIYIEEEIPKMYVVAKNVTYIDNIRRDESNVTAAVTFNGIVEERKGIYFTFSHFDPLSDESLRECVTWIRDKYVRGMYRGQVLTDFDEHKKHFSDVFFPVNYLMNPNPDQSQVSKLRDLLRDHLELDEGHIKHIINKKYVIFRMSHDTYNIAGPITGKYVVIGSGTINANEQLLEKISDKYANSLKQFSNTINEQLKGVQMPKEKVESIKSSINDLAEEVKDVQQGKENEIEYDKQIRVESKTATVIQKVLDVLPQAADTASTFTPLAPFHALIGKGVQQIVDAIKSRRDGNNA